MQFFTTKVGCGTSGFIDSFWILTPWGLNGITASEWHVLVSQQKSSFSDVQETKDLIWKVSLQDENEKLALATNRFGWLHGLRPLSQVPVLLAFDPKMIIQAKRITQGKLFRLFFMQGVIIFKLKYRTIIPSVKKLSDLKDISMQYLSSSLDDFWWSVDRECFKNTNQGNLHTDSLSLILTLSGKSNSPTNIFYFVITVDFKINW